MQDLRGVKGRRQVRGWAPQGLAHGKGAAEQPTGPQLAHPRGQGAQFQNQACPSHRFPTTGLPAPALLSQSQGSRTASGQKDAPGGGVQDLLEAEEGLVDAKGPHQHGHSRVTDGVALQAADRTWHRGCPRTQRAARPAWATGTGSTGSRRPGDCSSRPSLLPLPTC